MPVGKNATTTISTSSWKDLGKGKLTARSGGRTRTLHVRRKTGKGARVTKVTVSGGAKGAPRVLWKGAITFGLVHIPVGLYTATRPHGIDFDWLDKRSMDPVGYKRINKRTGREVTKEQIVKGVATSGFGGQ